MAALLYVAEELVCQYEGSWMSCGEVGSRSMQKSSPSDSSVAVILLTSADQELKPCQLIWPGGKVNECCGKGSGVVYRAPT